MKRNYRYVPFISPSLIINIEQFHVLLHYYLMVLPCYLNLLFHSFDLSTANSL